MKFMLIGALLALPVLADSTDDPKRRADDQKRIEAAAVTLSEIMHAKDSGIPQDLMKKAHCVGIIPSLKRAGFIVGAKYGKGVVTCRMHDSNRWTAPSMIILEGGNIGFQIGVGETDVIFTVMNQSGEDKLMKDKITIGADAAGMIGPLGRETQAQTDALMHAEILSWSRSRGVFAGVSLEGASLRADNDDNRALYGRDIRQQEILHGEVMPPPEARAIYTELDRYAPKSYSRKAE
jgi:lipid-binding SYLF domain-containing protein